MKMRKITLYGFLIFAGVWSVSPQQEVVITIKDGMPAIPLAIPDFVVRSTSAEIKSVAQELHQIVQGDLNYSRVFQLLPRSYYSYIRPLDPENIFFKDWESIQAKILLVGEVSEKEGNNISFEGKIYDVKAGRFISGKRLESDRKALRLMAHKMADELLRVFGEKPIFTTKIVFVSDRDGNDELYMMDYDGYNQTRLTFNTKIDYMPSWSPDGRKIAYTSYQGHNALLFLADLYEGKRVEIAGKGTNFSPAFSPDGKKIAFCSTIDEGNPEIYVYSIDSKEIKRLTFNSAIDTAPTWSPTGREIAFTSDRGGGPQIYVMDAEGSNVRRVSFGGSYHDAPAWSPTGDRIAYVSRVEQIVDIYVLNLRTSQIVKLTESNANNESPAWSPDGRHLVFSSNLSGTAQLYSIDYDGFNLKRLTSLGKNKLPDWSQE